MESEKTDSPSHLSAWLASVSDWVDTTELELQGQDSILPRSLSSRISTSLSPPNSFTFHKTQARQRKRNMNSDTASNTSEEMTKSKATATSATSFQNRPILYPTPPSIRQRSSSPTRKVLSQLKLATPSLRVYQPDVRLEQPPAVRQLRSMLIKKLSSNVIPRSLETRL